MPMDMVLHVSSSSCGRGGGRDALHGNEARASGGAAATAHIAHDPPGVAHTWLLPPLPLPPPPPPCPGTGAGAEPKPTYLPPWLGGKPTGLCSVRWREHNAAYVLRVPLRTHAQCARRLRTAMRSPASCARRTRPCPPQSGSAGPSCSRPRRRWAARAPSAHGAWSALVPGTHAHTMPAVSAAAAARRTSAEQKK
jgi:hypothetical protein